MARTEVVIMRPLIAAVVLGVLLDASACSPLQQARPDPLRFSSAQHFLLTDSAKMSLDLGRELEDAGHGPNGPNGLPSCYNLTQNVNVDVTAMDNFASGTVTSDITAMQNDVAVMRSERADFVHDINDFVNDGVPRPAYEPLTISAITKEIDNAVAGADTTIMAIQADLRAAHTAAGKLATGACVGDAPSSAPAIPLVH